MGSLNISQSCHNRSCVFLGGRYTSVELLDVTGLCGFRCHPSVICRVDTSVFLTCNFFWLICTARYVLSSLKTSYGETKFEIIREDVGHLHFVLLRGARMFDLILQVRLLLITGVSYLSLSSFARAAVVFLVESYKTVIERRSYVSFINIIKLFDLPVWSFCKSKDPVSVKRKFVDCFTCCLWFCSGKSSEVRSSSYDCSSSSMLWSSLLLYAMLLGFLGTVDSSSSVTVGGSLSLVAQAIHVDHFRWLRLYFCIIFASLMKTRLCKQHKPHKTATWKTDIMHYLTINTEGRDGRKKVSTTSKFLVEIKGQKSQRYLPTICRKLDEKNVAVLDRRSPLLCGENRATTAPDLEEFPAIWITKMPLLASQHVQKSNKIQCVKRFIYPFSLKARSSTRVASSAAITIKEGVRLQGFIALSCQQDHPLGEPQQDTFPYFYSLRSLAVFKRGNRDNKPQSCEEPGRETTEKPRGSSRLRRFTRARKIA